jgi:hypothetical protein
MWSRISNTAYRTEKSSWTWTGFTLLLIHHAETPAKLPTTRRFSKCARKRISNHTQIGTWLSILILSSTKHRPITSRPIYCRTTYPNDLTCRGIRKQWIKPVKLPALHLLEVQVRSYTKPVILRARLAKKLICDVLIKIFVVQPTCTPLAKALANQTIYKWNSVCRLGLALPSYV